MTRFIFLRHGESEGNVAGIINDDPARTVNLTARGRTQAGDAALVFAPQRFACAYASQLARARQTAEILLRQHKCELRIDARINERKTGMDGLPVHRFHDLRREDRVRFKPSGGESFLEEMERVRSFLDEAAARHGDATVLAVSHEDPILAAMALVSGDPKGATEQEIANCGWVALDWPPA